MGENRIIVESGTVNAIPAAAAGSFFYNAAIGDVPGVVAANNYLSLFNPIGSGKTVVLGAEIVVPWASAASATAVSMNSFRITAASGGTLQTPDKFVTAAPASIAEVRKGNPTVTTIGASLGGWPPAMTTAAAGGTAYVYSSAPGGALVLVPGEGIVLTTASGNTAQLWNLGFVWVEI